MPLVLYFFQKLQKEQSYQFPISHQVPDFSCYRGYMGPCHYLLFGAYKSPNIIKHIIY